MSYPFYELSVYSRIPLIRNSREFIGLLVYLLVQFPSITPEISSIRFSRVGFSPIHGNVGNHRKLTRISEESIRIAHCPTICYVLHEWKGFNDPNEILK